MTTSSFRIAFKRNVFSRFASRLRTRRESTMRRDSLLSIPACSVCGKTYLSRAAMRVCLKCKQSACPTCVKESPCKCVVCNNCPGTHVFMCTNFPL